MFGTALIKYIRGGENMRRRYAPKGRKEIYVKKWIRNRHISQRFMIQINIQDLQLQALRADFLLRDYLFFFPNC